LHGNNVNRHIVLEADAKAAAILAFIIAALSLYIKQDLQENRGGDGHKIGVKLTLC
jgi:hypothetical protein